MAGYCRRHHLCRLCHLHRLHPAGWHRDLRRRSAAQDETPSTLGASSDLRVGGSTMGRREEGMRRTYLLRRSPAGKTEGACVGT